MDTRMKILLVDDSPEVLSSLISFLGDEYQTFVATTGTKALEIAEKEDIDLILLDITLPDISGIDICQQLKWAGDNDELPIIFITGETAAQVEKEGLEAGAIDFIHKPINPPIVKARVETHLFNYQQKKRLRQEFDSLSSVQESILRNAPIGIAHIDANKEIQVWNKVMQSLTGIGFEDISLPKLLSLFPPMVSNEIHEVLSGKEEHLLKDNISLIFRGTEHYCRILFTALHNGESDEGVTLLLRDTTEEVRAEEEKKELQNQLQQVQKMEAIGTLAGGIAHDFNNLLGAIIGFSELAMEEANELSREYLQEVLNASERARDLVSQILVFSRKSDLKTQHFRLSSFVKESIKFLKATIPSSISLVTHIESEEDTILCNPTQINQVIMNLCVNASHAIGDKPGEIIIALKKQDMHTIDSNLKQQLQSVQENYIRLEIQDNGSGMSEELQKRVFEPFFTTKEIGVGTGMGLSVVHGVVKSIGGAIAIKSTIGVGTTFSILLPLAEQEQEERSVITEERITGNGNILLVDDEIILTKVYSSMLQERGYTVTAVNNPLDALEVLFEESFDILITDKTMPRMSGLQLAKKVHEQQPELPILLVTGFEEAITEETLQQYGIKAIIPKPFSGDTIIKMINSVLVGTA